MHPQIAWTTSPNRTPTQPTIYRLGAHMSEPQIPNSGRIIDHWLGGTHHYPADAAAASEFAGLYPGFPQVYRTLREFVGRAVRAVADEGVDQFLVLGAGIPTQGNVHEVVPRARVLYTDIDPANIALGREILATTPGVDYAYCDASDPGTLDQESAERILDLTARLGVVVVGISTSLDDGALQDTLSDLFDWAPPGSFLVADFDGEALASLPTILAKILDQAGQPLHLRGPDRIRPLLGRWQLTDDGICAVDVWRSPTPHPDKVFVYGCVSHKPYEMSQ